MRLFLFFVAVVRKSETQKIFFAAKRSVRRPFFRNVVFGRHYYIRKTKQNYVRPVLNTTSVHY